MSRIAIILLVSLSLTACRFEPSSTEKNPNGTGSSLTVVKARYYRGGYMSAPGQPHWSHDMTIDFSTGQYSITAKTHDSLCGKAGLLTLVEADRLFDLISDLRLFKSSGPVLAGQGTETIELIAKNGTIHRYHLLAGEVPAGEMYADNGAELSNFLKDIEADLAVYCQ